MTERLQIARAAAGIIRLGSQQLEDILASEGINPQEAAAVLREVFCESDPGGGVLGAVAQLLTTAAGTADRLDADGDGDASCPLQEAAGFIAGATGDRVYAATRVLDPEGERTP
ncbi:hypothetical protein OIE69_43940 (plasmid) [Actinacidiphila glaucinigra]|uniref:hypothetical protein n=1 Tax=Actinacidiphila glaucinigra TaxID=235986 RepID=UPI002DD8CDDA|nr:hypothetical protein [Actinacidiphila glaucinigra]WSD65857.1 hypothetical protein OIE69_43940 [Actinacidiphila glaucinigra]